VITVEADPVQAGTFGFRLTWSTSCPNAQGPYGPYFYDVVGGAKPPGTTGKRPKDLSAVDRTARKDDNEALVELAKLAQLTVSSEAEVDLRDTARFIQEARAALPSEKIIKAIERSRLEAAKRDLQVALAETEKMEFTVSEESTFTPASIEPELRQTESELQAAEQVM